MVFAGGPTPQRIRLEAIADKGLTIHGYDEAGWRASETLRACYAGELMERERLRDVYQRAAISVNITRPHGPSSLNMRVFEAMACGSLVITDDRSDANGLFAEDREIVIYRSPQDLRRKVAYYLRHDDESRAIAAAGARRVRDAHSYLARLRSVRDPLKQFQTETTLFARLDHLVESAPADAIDEIDRLHRGSAIQLGAEALTLLEARAHDALGHPDHAARCAGRVLVANPAHLHAATLAQRLRKAG